MIGYDAMNDLVREDHKPRVQNNLNKNKIMNPISSELEFHLRETKYDKPLPTF